MALRNHTMIKEFLLLGLSSNPKTEAILFIIFMIGYVIILTGNFVIIMLVLIDKNLHTPMYFLLLNLSFVDICFSTTTIPRLLRDFVSSNKIIPYGECAAQLYIALIFGETDGILLAIMAYDRYVAICYPLQYTTIMNKIVCLKIAACTWVCALLLPIIHVVLILNAELCGNNEINDFLCEVPEILSMTCENTIFIESTTYVIGVIVLIIPVIFIVASYINIILSILRIASSAGRRKAFSTCGSHMTVVTLFYGSIIAAYMKPRSSSTPKIDKLITIFYCIVTPVLNPIIYTLRNNDVKMAFLKFRSRYSFF